MSTHATPETRDAPTAEPTTDPTPSDPSRADGTDAADRADGSDPAGTPDDPAPIDPFDAHNGAATFGESTDSLPNTVDEENAYLFE